MGCCLVAIGTFPELVEKAHKVQVKLRKAVDP